VRAAAGRALAAVKSVIRVLSGSRFSRARGVAKRVMSMLD
jgi:hypothetical protein